MDIKSPKELKKAIKEVVSGKSDLIFDIARYVTYNYYMYTHIKKDSPEDKENEKIYKQFEKKHPEHFKAVELWVDYLFKKFEK